VLLCAIPCAALTTPKHTHAPSNSASAKTHKPEHAVQHHDDTGMEPERATEIQTALIHAGYLSGEPSGTWDAASIAATQKLQEDNGWQTKIVPDSRALIKLGLGPQAPANVVATAKE
jgi:hypothetical protein